MNKWFKILEAAKMSKFPNIYNGFTPRFLVGACQIPIGKKFEDPELAKEVTKQMFNEMQEFDNGEFIVMTNFCDIHKGPIMSLTSQIRSKSSFGVTFEELWNRYGSEIIDGDYHISPEEKEIVEQIFNEL